MKKHGKSINIYLMDGDAEGRYQVSLANWNVRAYKIPFNMLSASDNLEKIHTPGVYFLFGYQNGEKAVYVGEAEDIYKRLSQHTPIRDKFVWDSSVVFISTDIGAFNKAKIKNLESRLYSAIKKADSYHLWNRNVPEKSRLDVATEDAMGVVVENIELVVPVLGYTPFKKKVNHSEEPYTTAEPESNEQLFYLKAKGIEATCRLNSNGDFILLAGSQIYPTETKSLKPYIRKRREKLFASNLVKYGILQEDVKYKSSSTLASVVLGTEKDGRTALKMASGQSLKSYQEEHS